MARFFSIILFFVLVATASGCMIARPYGHFDGSYGYNAGYAVGASILSRRGPVILPDPLVLKVSPDHAQWAQRALSEPGWYSCGSWSYSPDGMAVYYWPQAVYMDYVTRQYRLTQTPSRPSPTYFDGSRQVYSDPCFHAR